MQKRIATGVLACIVCISLAFPMELYAYAVEEIDSSDAVAEEFLSEESDAAGTDESQPSDEESSADVSDDETGEDVNAQDLSATNQSSVAASSNLANSNGEQQWSITEEDVTLEYDDRYSVANLEGGGWKILSIETLNVESTQVSTGENTSILDTDVVELKDGSDTDLVASGVGEATVLLVQEDQYDLARALLESQDEEEFVEAEASNGLSTTKQSSDEAIEILQLNITVEPATLTLMYVWGQSNAEGSSTSSTGYQPSDSVMCDEGEVYSTYAPSTITRGKNIAGVSFSSACTASNADDFVAGSLTGNESISGTELEYSLDSLTESGSGKTGPDSGLAYAWNQLTGDKVWVVNAANGGTSISTWLSGGSCYEKAMVVSTLVQQTYQAEIDAGHYVEGDCLLFWLQGETDKNVAADSYYESLETLYNLVDENLGIDGFGIIMVRASTGSYVNEEDISMNGPRIAQYAAGASADMSKLFVVSNVNEQWVSDEGVSAYFGEAYPEGYLSYPTHSGVTALPSTVSEVHSDIHYSQVAHNENGITAAEGMYAALYGSDEVESVYWADEDGNYVSSVALGVGDTATIVPVASPVYCSKQVSYSADNANISFDVQTGTLTASTVGTSSLYAISSQGDTISSVEISIANVATPVLTGTTPTKSGVKVSWNSVSAATGYAVYRKTSGGSWSMIATTTSTSYTDTTTLSAGTTYYYTVRAYKGTETEALANKYNSLYWSGYDSSGVTAVYLATPTLKSATAAASGTKITWSSVSGATGYAIYRKVSDGSWSMIATTTSTSYTDTTSLSAGKTYYYTVRAYKGDIDTAKSNKYSAYYWSYYNTTGLDARYLATPTLSSATKTSSGTKISWSSVSKATGYAVYRKTSSGSWTLLGTTTSTSYTDKSSLTSGTTYYYTVRAYIGSKATSNKYDAYYWSGYDTTGVSSRSLTTPTLNSQKSVASGIKITWSKVSGATGYAIYRKTSGGSWTMIDTTTSTSYTDTSSLSSGTTYYYTVRAYKGTLSTAKSNKYSAYYWSYYDTSGIKTKYLATPTLSNTTKTSSGVKVTWSSVSKASGYAVYRKTSGGSWAMLGTTTSTSYTDTTAKSGASYYYTVRAYQGTKTTALANKYSSLYWSGYDSSGIESTESEQE